MCAAPHNQWTIVLGNFCDVAGLLFGHKAAEGGELHQLIRNWRLGKGNRRRRIIHCAVSRRGQVDNLFVVGEHVQRGLRLPVHIDGALLGLATRQPDQTVHLGQIAALIDGQRHIRLEDVH